MKMAQTAKRVNFMISDDIRKEFEELVPAGERSRIVNEALRKELLTIKRKKLTEKLISLRAEGKMLSTGEIIETIRKDRERTI
jgi:hypothetical protein